MNNSKIVRVGFADIASSQFLSPIISLKDARECKMTGSVGAVLQILYDSIYKSGYNCNIVLDSDQGKYDELTGKWSGLIGKIQENEIDMSLFMFERPLKNLDIEYSIPLFESQMCLGCSYNYTNSSVHYDVIDMFLNYDILSYEITACMFLFFVLLWLILQKLISLKDEDIKIKFQNRRISSFWINLWALLDQDQYPSVGLVSFSILTICISMFYWLMFDNWMLGIMGTDMTLFKEPHVVYNYKDVLKSKAKIGFSTMLPEAGFFRDAPEGSEERQLWDSAYLVGTDFENLLGKLWYPVISQEIIASFRCVIAYIGAQLGIKNTRQMGFEYIRAFIIPDPKGYKLTQYHIFQKDLPEDLGRPIRKLISRLTTSGIYELNLEGNAIKDAFGESIYRERFVSAKVMTPDMPEPFVAGADIVRLLLWTFYAICFCTTVLLVEIIVGKFKNRKKKMKVQPIRQVMVARRRDLKQPARLISSA